MRFSPKFNPKRSSLINKSSDTFLPNFLVLGAVRNCEKTLEKSVKSIHSAIGHNKSVSWFLVESDSQDETLAVLEKLSSQIPDFKFESMGNLRKAIPNRVERIRYCREVYFNWAKSQDFVKPNNYLVVADFDGINQKLKPNLIFETVVAFPNFAACFANNKGRYYDLLALRCSGWLDRDYREVEAQLESAGYSKLKSKYLLLSHFQIKIATNLPPIQVNSAFGGLAIYNSNFIDSGTTYLAKKYFSECEHVSFNETLRPGTRAIIPSLLNGRSREHTLSSYFSRPDLIFRFLFGEKELISSDN